MRLAIFLVGSLLSVSCAVPAPKGWMCMFNAQGHYKYCYNLEKDFDPKTGDVKPGVHGQRVPVQSLDDLHAHIVMDVDSYAQLKAFILKQKARCEAKQ